MSEPFGATGKFPQGSLGPHDEGELQLGVARDGQGNVHINFGKDVSWIAFSSEQAIDFARLRSQERRRQESGNRAMSNSTGTIPESVSPQGLRARADIERRWNYSCARHLELAADEIERLQKALEEINGQAVCAAIAQDGECFEMLQNCAEISDAALTKEKES